MIAYLVHEILQPDVSLSCLYYGGQSMAIPHCKESALICLECIANPVVNNYIKFVSFQNSDEWKNAFRCSDRINLFKRQQVSHLKSRMI